MDCKIIIPVFVILVFLYSNNANAQAENAIGVSYEQCQRQIHDEMNKTVSLIDRQKAISLASSSKEFQTKTADQNYTFSNIFTNMTWSDASCGDVKLEDITIQFSVLNDGKFERFVQVDEDPDLKQVIGVRDVFVQACQDDCPPAKPISDSQKNTGPDTIFAKCLDGTQFLRQGTVDIIQLGDDGKFQVGKKTKLVASILDRDGKQKTMGLRLQILSLHPEIIVDETRQVVFDSCPSRAIVEWEFTPKVPGKHWITLKEDTFGGSDYSTNINVSDPSGKTIRDYIISPLKQFESGVAPEKTICQVPLQMIIRADDHPACVKPTSIHRLWLSSWAKKSTDIYTEYSTNEILEKFRSKIISGDAALQIVQDYIKKNNLVLNVDTHSPDFQITTNLVYSNLATGSLGMLDVDPETGLPTGVMGPFAEKYYKNPQWWSELQKDYLGMKSDRVEDGEVIWRVTWRDCPNCIAQYPEFFIDAINGTILGSPDRR